MIAEATKLHDRHTKTLGSYFIGDKPFIAGDTASIADILAATTLEQTAQAGADHSRLGDYQGRVARACADWEELHEVCSKIPETLRGVGY